MEYEKLIRKRASVRRYSKLKPNIEEVMKILHNANFAPSPGNLPIIKYLVIEDLVMIDKIAEACQQDFVKQSQILILVCSECKRAEILYEKRAKKYITQHAGAIIESLLLEITNRGFVSCWIGAFSDLTLRNLLNIPENIEIEAIIPVAYPAKTDRTEQKKKPTLEGRIFFGTWGNKFRKPYIKLTT